MARYDVEIAYNHGWLKLMLARDEKGRKLWDTRTLDPIRPTVQLGDASYSSLIPGVSAVFAQPDLSLGMGVFDQKERSDRRFPSYKHGEKVDASIPGYLQKGPSVTTVTAPTNSGTLESMFEISGVPYLVLGRIIASYAGGALTQQEDLGSGKSGYDSVMFPQMAAEASDQSATTDDAGDNIDAATDLLAQQFQLATTRYLSKVTVKLSRTDLSAVQRITLNGTPTAGNFTVTYAGATTANIAWNASAATVQTELRLLAGLGSVTVTQSGFTYDVTFVGLPGVVSEMTGDGGGLTSATTANVTVTTIRIGLTVSGLIEMAVQADWNSKPSGTDLAVASVSAQAIPLTTAANVSFFFDDDNRVLLESGAPYHLVLRAPGALPVAYLTWRRDDGTPESYANGNGEVSTDGGESWSDNSNDYVFDVFTRAITETAFVAMGSADAMQSSTNGAGYSAESYYAKHLAVYWDLLVRDTRITSTGAIQWSTDGENWSAPLPIGSEGVPVTGLLALSGCVIVVKEDGIWAVDPSAETITVQPLYQQSTRQAANGTGAAVYKNVAYIPFAGKLAHVSGDFASGFKVEDSCGPESLPEWHSPWGAGCYVAAVAGDKHWLYAAYRTPASGYKLLKHSNPATAVVSGEGWHGSIADLGSPTTLHAIRVWDPGGGSNPYLFASTGSYNVAAIKLATTANPAADTGYLYTTGDAELFYSRANMNFSAYVKAWLDESVTFAEEVSGGYQEILYDTLDGRGYRRLARMYRTGSMPYPDDLQSRTLDRKAVLVSTDTSECPIVLASALSGAVLASREAYSFTVELGSGASADLVGDLLLRGVKEVKAAVKEMVGGGTREMKGPDGDKFRVKVLTVAEKLIEMRERENHVLLVIEAVAA